MMNKECLMVVSDLHGNWDHYQKYLEIFDNYKKDGLDIAILFIGDFIDASRPEDNSYKIIQDMMDKVDFTEFGVLLGNHEDCFLKDEVLFKWEDIECDQWSQDLSDEEIDNVKEFFKGLFDTYVTPNNILITHGGLPLGLDNPYWTIPTHQYSPKDAETYLRKNHLDWHIMGHVHIPYGYNFIGSEMIITSSRYQEGYTNLYYMLIPQTHRLKQDEFINCLKEFKDVKEE